MPQNKTKTQLVKTLPSLFFHQNRCVFQARRKWCCWHYFGLLSCCMKPFLDNGEIFRSWGLNLTKFIFGAKCVTKKLTTHLKLLLHFNLKLSWGNRKKTFNKKKTRSWQYGKFFFTLNFQRKKISIFARKLEKILISKVNETQWCNSRTLKTRWTFFSAVYWKSRAKKFFPYIAMEFPWFFFFAWTF